MRHFRITLQVMDDDASPPTGNQRVQPRPERRTSAVWPIRLRYTRCRIKRTNESGAGAHCAESTSGNSWWRACRTGKCARIDTAAIRQHIQLRASTKSKAKHVEISVILETLRPAAARIGAVDIGHFLGFRIDCRRVRRAPNTGLCPGVDRVAEPTRSCRFDTFGVGQNRVCMADCTGSRIRLGGCVRA
ncbi:hypothetical protein EVAR_6967_1 [Eumeta japonica]|uniref:Uncharacterized protein n=1 Tax=Eumeta variegata TaxID=151549 RepID=A0A4C1TJ57_EUMVA|nr:hypothetical protein EVAR_6967_1 [Eumeta japonica]